jgi:hypothetical protein
LEIEAKMIPVCLGSRMITVDTLTTNDPDNRR